MFLCYLVIFGSVSCIDLRQHQSQDTLHKILATTNEMFYYKAFCYIFCKLFHLDMLYNTYHQIKLVLIKIFPL